MIGNNLTIKFQNEKKKKKLNKTAPSLKLCCKKMMKFQLLNSFFSTIFDPVFHMFLCLDVDVADYEFGIIFPTKKW